MRTEHQRKLHRDQMRRYRARKKNPPPPPDNAKTRRRKTKREAMRKYRAENEHARITDRVRARVHECLAAHGTPHSQSLQHYLGYPIAELAAWVKARGGIPPGHHLDHIVPFAEMRRRYPNDILRQQREAWKFANLQIIPAADNLTKAGKRVTLV